ncbi:MAG: hypothetical protein K5981_09080 [Clostridia bacterium]|nr:hypothetical protein [Clostridia bacterium]
MSNKVRIELNREGVQALLRSSEMMDAVAELARSAQGRLGDGYEVSTYAGRNRVNASIEAATAEARRENMETNSILKALK